MTEDPRKHPFSADHSISSAQEDLLGRAGFAEALASAIRGWKGDDSFVVALYGSWESASPLTTSSITRMGRKEGVNEPQEKTANG